MRKSYTRMVQVIFVIFSLSQMNGYTFLRLILSNQSLGVTKEKVVTFLLGLLASCK